MDGMLTAILILLILMLVNAVFAMSELAVMTSRQARLQHAAQRGRPGAAAALALARQPTRFLSTVQVGITLIGILAGAFGEKQLSGYIQPLFERVPMLARHSDEMALLVVVLLVTYFSLVLGELIPKRIALAYPERVAATIAGPLTFLSAIAGPAVRFLTWSTDSGLAILRVPTIRHDDVSEEDVKSLVSRAASTGVFTPQEHRLLQRVLRVGDLTVRDLMVPRSDIIWIDESMSAQEVRLLAGTSPHSHFPVCQGDLDRIVGVVHVRDLISHGLIAGHDFKVADVARQPLYIPRSMPALKLLDQFQTTRNHVAVVVDEYGGVLGLLTLNDVVSVLLGDVSRQGEEPKPKAVRREDGSWLIDGRLPLHEMMATLEIPDTDEPLPDVSTVAGLVMAQLGNVPSEGQHAVWRHWRLEVVDMDGTRVDKIIAAPAPPPPPPPEDDAGESGA
ncbi:MAG: HlyC/CorC family transporter [Phycisphaeraceae bacterium]|nr:HlyC/CorC family transporter [Phycisphaeraceae bacterium]